jgi:hypothetical protein
MLAGVARENGKWGRHCQRIDAAALASKVHWTEVFSLFCEEDHHLLSHFLLAFEGV